MMLTVREVYDQINELAPFDTQESYDNAGLIVGSGKRTVKNILVALDVTEDVVCEAQKKNAELIISHHPLMFHARKNMTEDDPEGRILCTLVRNRISVIAAHTNLDKTVYSGSACIAEMMRMSNVTQDDYLFYGDLSKEMTAADLRAEIERALRAPVRLYGRQDKIIKRLAIGGGACDGEWLRAQLLPTDAFLTGEVRHHNALASAMEDYVLFDGTHYGTENVLVTHFADTLQTKLNELKYEVNVFPSETDVFRF